ncbi:hypothetical protein FDECE_6951 [Fusarium decemcellulare]|nr:hypothetical protein FDECE_6951 [Fusarium decemcellulare]
MTFEQLHGRGYVLALARENLPFVFSRAMHKSVDESRRTYTAVVECYDTVNDHDQQDIGTETMALPIRRLGEPAPHQMYCTEPLYKNPADDTYVNLERHYTLGLELDGPDEHERGDDRRRPREPLLPQDRYQEWHPACSSPRAGSPLRSPAMPVHQGHLVDDGLMSVGLRDVEPCRDMSMKVNAVPYADAFLPLPMAAATELLLATIMRVFGDGGPTMRKLFT